MARHREDRNDSKGSGTPDKPRGFGEPHDAAGSGKSDNLAKSGDLHDAASSANPANSSNLAKPTNPAKRDKTYVLADMPVGRAVAYLVVPTILTQIISILYNLADTFFIGKLGDPALVAAVGVCLPPMVIMTALANLFGVGASSVISRALGSGDEQRARLCSSFSFWCGLGTALAYVLITVVLRGPFIAFVGGAPDTSPYVARYLTWTMTYGGLVFFTASLLTHFLKTLGKAGPASIAVAAGAVLNIVLDPVFLLIAQWGIDGVAIASLLGQCLTLALLAGYLLYVRGEGVITLRPSAEAFRSDVGREVVQIGFVSFCMTSLAQVSNACINILISPYGAQYVAASSIAIKLNIASFSLAQGLSVGVLPLLGFNYAARKPDRVKSALKIEVAFAACVTGLFGLTCALFPEAIVAFFIDDPVTVECGRFYVFAIALTTVPSALVFCTSSYLQAIGQKRRPLILAFTRMGTVDVLFMVILSMTAGVDFILFGKPMADWLCLVTALLVLNNLRRHVNPFERE